MVGGPAREDGRTRPVLKEKMRTLLKLSEGFELSGDAPSSSFADFRVPFLLHSKVFFLVEGLQRIFRIVLSNFSFHGIVFIKFQFPQAFEFQFRRIFKMERNVGQWIIPVKHRKSKKFSYRGGSGNVELLKKAFDAPPFKNLKLADRITKSHLGPMYESLSKFKYSSPVIYNILVRAVHFEEADEMLFRFGDKTCRFGRHEFAMVSGLSFRPLQEDDVGIYETLTSSLLAMKDPVTGVITRTYKVPFDGPLTNVNVQVLESTLARINEEDIDRFLSYPGGTFFWERSLSSWKQKVVNMRDAAKSNRSSSNDNIHGLVSVLNAWVLETLPHETRLEFGVSENMKIPRILRWSTNHKRILFKEVSKIFTSVKTGA